MKGRSDRLPSTVANGSRSITHAPYGESLNFNAQDESSPDHRKLFFSYLGLALKYRWLILVFCGIALAIGFILTFTSTPIYQATVTIQIDRQAQKVVKVDTVGLGLWEGGPRFYQTQYDLLKAG